MNTETDPYNDNLLINGKLWFLSIEEMIFINKTNWRNDVLIKLKKDFPALKTIAIMHWVGMLKRNSPTISLTCGLLSNIYDI